MFNIWTVTKHVNVQFKFLLEIKAPEAIFYWVAWFGSIGYSVWLFSEACARKYHLLYSEDFQDGWAILNRKKDISDEEWANIKGLFQGSWPWLFGQIFLSQMLFRKWPKWLPYFYAVFSLVFLINWMGMNSTLIYLGHILIMYAIHKIGSRILCYVTGILMLISTIKLYYTYFGMFIVQDEMKRFLFDIGLGWLVTKCISFGVDRINNHTFKSSSLDDLCGILCYCFYQPTVFCGPLIAYDSFMQQLPESSKKWDLQRACSVATKTCVYLYFFICLEFCTHFLYSSALQFYPTVASEFDTWPLCGYGFSLCLIFYLKYKLIYGVAGFLAEIEGFSFPSPPKFICRVHLSSYQWRYFDRGLHLWLAKYFARPILQHGRTAFLKILSVFLCFTFVFIWHGMRKSIGIWSYLSCFGVLAEYVASEIASIKSIQQFGEKRPLWYRRIRAFFGAMAFMIMTVSCIFFLSNMKGGMLFVHRVLGYPIPFVTTFFVFYCGSHVSMDVAEYEAKSSNIHHETEKPKDLSSANSEKSQDLPSAKSESSQDLPKAKSL